MIVVAALDAEAMVVDADAAIAAPTTVKPVAVRYVLKNHTVDFIYLEFY